MAPSKSVLIIDDDSTAHRLYTTALAGMNLSFQSCWNGLEGYNELLRQRYDIVLLDLAMPNIDGVELMKRLNAEKVKYPPVIVISGLEKRNLISECYETGAASYLRKPVRTPFLRLTVKSVLEMTDATDQALNDVVENIERIGKSATVRVKTAQGQAVLMYENGRLASASYLGLSRYKALEKLMRDDINKIELEHKN
ncbi:MAG: response regulator [Chlorobiales bacterium]|jgi:DNA-binding response OmpR family regulator|nr:response regulator [Chlorobiales bacterium]